MFPMLPGQLSIMWGSLHRRLEKGDGVMKKVQSTGKKAEPWPYVPYKVVANAFTIESWDKKAPPGYVRNVEALSVSNPGAKEEDKYINMFSDENPNACSIM
ncbi:hypothetical protein ACLOJK_016141 [Asimina triloba]